MKLSARDPDFCFNLMVQTQSATAVAEAAHTQDTLIIIHAAFPAMDVFRNTLLEPVKQNEETTKKDLMMLVLPFAKFMEAKVDDMGPDILSITSLIDEEAVLKETSPTFAAPSKWTRSLCRPPLRRGTRPTPTQETLASSSKRWRTLEPARHLIKATQSCQI